MPGIAFLRHLCNTVRDLSKPHHRRKLSLWRKEDSRVWLKFLDGFNGVSFWWEEVRLGAEFQVNLDSAGLLGYGIYV